MERVLGFGGLFFRSKDPAALLDWYRRHLGISAPPGTTDDTPWMQEAGPTVFAPFPTTSDYFAPDHAFMFNFRVRDLEAMLHQLKAGGVEVPDISDYPYGRFARIHDPEGNPIELWEPKEPPAD